MTSRRHVIASKNLNYLSQLRDGLKSCFFVSMGFFGQRVQKCYQCYQIFNCLMSWRHDVMSWCHKTWFIIYLSQLVDVLESWFFLFPWFVGSKSSKMLLSIYLFVWCCDVTKSCHDVTKPDVPISTCRCARKNDSFCFYNFLLSLSLKMLSIFICSMFRHHDVMSWRHKTWFTYLSL